MKKIVLFLPILVLFFACGTTKQVPVKLKDLTIDYFNQSKYKTFFTQEPIHLIDGFDEIYIPQGRSCLLDTVMRADTVIGRAFFGTKAEPDSEGKDMSLKIQGEPFLIYLLNEQKEFYLTDWSEHPDSTAYDSGVNVKGKQRFWKIEAGKESKLGVDPTKRVSVLLGKSDPKQPKEEPEKKKK